jgi:hypothetical protein
LIPFFDTILSNVRSYKCTHTAVYRTWIHCSLHISIIVSLRRVDRQTDLMLGYVKYTVIKFVSISAKFGICTVVDTNGTLTKAKTHIQVSQRRILASTSFPFSPMTVQMQNFALIETNGGIQCRTVQ